MSDDANEEDGIYLDPEDILQVIDLDDENAIENLVRNGFGNGMGTGDDEQGDGAEGQDEDGDEMDTGQASAANPTRDDSVLTFSGHQNDAVICCQMHPQSTEIAVTGGQDDKALVWNPQTGALLFQCTGHSDTIVGVGFSADGTMVASADMKGLIQVWAVPSGALAWYFEVEEIEWIQWHQVAPVLLAGTKDGAVWMWKVPAGDCKTFASHGTGALCGRILHDGKHCCVGYEDGVVKVWSLKESEVTLSISGHDAHTASVLCMDAKDELVATGSEDGTAKIINLNSGKVTSTFQCGIHGDDIDSVEAVAFSSVNPYLVTGTLGGRMEVWDLPTKSVRHRMQHPYGIVKIQWSPSSSHFYTACLDGCIRRFDSQSGQLISTFQGHTNGILDFCLAKDESFVLTSSDDFTAKVFSLTSGAQQT